MQKQIPTEKLINMTKFALRNLLRTVIGTRCAPTYACTFMDKVEV